MYKVVIHSSGNQIIDPISCICGHCNKNVSLKVYAYYTYELTNTILYYTGQCPYCGKPIIYDNEMDITLPYISNFESVKFLPNEINELYKEIRDSYSIGSYTCCVITARTLMANIAVEQGAEINKSFVFYVEYLKDNCLPLRTNNEWVDKIRQLGNASTHEFVIATKEDAELAIKFIIAILKNVYEFPNSI